jgi:hypothetical protein
MISTEISPFASTPRKAKILLRVPALRTAGQVIFPGTGPMIDDRFMDLVRDAFRSGYRVYIKDLPPGQVAVPIVKTDGKISLAVSSEFRSQVQRFRAEQNRKHVQSPNAIHKLGNPSRSPQLGLGRGWLASTPYPLVHNAAVCR